MIKSCTLLAGLFTKLVLGNSLKFSSYLCWGYLMKNYTLLAKFSTCLVRGSLTCLCRGYMMESCTSLARLVIIR